MFTLVQIGRTDTSSAETASLVADYLAFDRRRTARRQCSKAFGGLALVVLLGAAFGRVPVDHAWIVIGLLSAVPFVLGIVELFQRHRLAGRLNGLRAQVQTVRKS